MNIQSMIIGVVVLSFALGAETEEEPNTWLERKRQEMQTWRSLEKEKKIEQFSGSLRTVGSYGERMSEEQKIIYNIAREELTNTPGIDTFFENKLKNIKLSMRERGRKGDYDLYRDIYFSTMRHIPHPGIVRVFGEFLNDDEDRPPPLKPGQDYVDSPANNIMAAVALGQMLEKPPVPKEPMIYSHDDVETWKLWYAQVKAGTRGFQFKGDSTVHYLTKPKETGRPPVEESRVTSAPPPIREQKNEPPAKAEVPAERPFPLVPTLIASALLLLSAGWLIVSKRRTALRGFP